MKNQLSPRADILQPKAFVVYSLTGWESTNELSKIQTDKLLTAEEGCGLFKCGNQFINFDGRIEQGYIYDLVDTKPKDHEEISSGR